MEQTRSVETSSAYLNGRRSGLTLAAVLLLTATFLYLAFRGANLSDLFRRIKQMDGSLACAAVLVVTVTLYLRARRWCLLLSVQKVADVMPIFWATAMGYLANYTLPARAGEILRSVAAARSTGLSNAYVLATALSERFFDAAVLVVIACLALAFMPSLPEWLWAAARIAALSAGVGLAGLLLLPRFSAVVNKSIRRLPCKPAMQDKIELIARQFLLGSGALSNGRRVLRFLLYTAFIWSLDSIGAVIVARCLHLQLSFSAALILIVSLALASAVPSAPGSLGISQFVAVTVLALFAFTRDDALLIILVWQCVIYTVLAVWGTVALWKLRQFSFRMKAASEQI